MKVSQHQRFVVCITDEQKRQIQEWVAKKRLSLTEFGRKALTAHIKKMEKLDKRQRLADTCRLFASETEGP